MTTQTDLRDAYQVADDFASGDERTKTLVMILLAEYDIDGDYETWCKNQLVDATNPQYEHEYHEIHMAYITVWDRIGSREFTRRLEEAKAFVVSRRRSRR